jgi:hypothetical protein
VEKVSFKNSRGLNLVGNLYQSNSKSIIIMCHGFMSDKYSKGRFEKLGIALNNNGFDASLYYWVLDSQNLSNSRTNHTSPPCSSA